MNAIISGGSGTEIPKRPIGGVGGRAAPSRWPVGQKSAPLGADSPGWRGDSIGYPGVHHRLARYRGPAKNHLCCRCGERAASWAYDHLDPNEKRDDRGRVYSTDPDHYMPMCALCHTRFDKEAAK